MKSSRIGVVIVTFNRINQLKIALRAYDEQSYKPKYIVVVNNNSTDGTTEYLNEWHLNSSEYSKYIINLEVNTGGSGGFYEGLKKSLDLDAEWIWVADDDAYPDLSAIEIADKIIEDKTIVADQVSAICGIVINNGNMDYVHRRRIFVKNLQICEVPVSAAEYKNKYFELQLFSYVGAIINRNILKQVGLPKKDYFIWYDDTEHSMRLSKKGKILGFPTIKIVHNVDKCTEINSIDWKYYYGCRNKLDFYKSHFSRSVYLFIHFSELFKAYCNILGKRKILKYKMRLEAAKDAYNGKLGLHEIYKPGWKLENKGE